MAEEQPTFTVALVAGGFAGLTVDTSLFPLDTIKTRLQSEKGFFSSGGFRGIYRGLGPAVCGSIPTAATFFCAYELSKTVGYTLVPESYHSGVHMVGASIGEVTACLVRVPVEVVKQRAQTSGMTGIQILRTTLRNEGFFGLFRGYTSTVVREVPFSFIQFPLWEWLKKRWAENQSKPFTAWQSALCGAAAGGFSAVVTTPLDVAKTRIMLAKKGSYLAKGNIIFALRTVRAEKGLKGLFAGVVPRVLWISIGGAIFLGAYDQAKSKLTVLQSYCPPG